MLKIAVLEQPEVVAIKLDGRLGGPWTTELRQTWKTLASSLGTRKVAIDLCNMTYADANGQRVLHEIYKESGASFLTNSPLTKHFAAEAMKTEGKGKRN